MDDVHLHTQVKGGFRHMLKNKWWVVVISALIITLAGGSIAFAGSHEDEYFIGFSNSGVGNVWAAAFYDRVVAELEALDNVRFTHADGGDDAIKQMGDVEDMMAMGVDLLIIRPDTPEILAVVVDEAYEAGIPTVIAGRDVATDNYTSFVWVDDVMLGRATAQAAVDLLIEKYGEPRGKVAILQGYMPGGSARSRDQGTMEVLEQYPDLEIVARLPADYVRATARDVMEDILMAQPEIDVLITHAGEMAVGAIEAMDAMGRKGEFPVTSIDGYNGVLKAIGEGYAHYTALYPVAMGALAVEVALDILAGKEVEKNIAMEVSAVTPENVEEFVDWDAPDSLFAH